MDCRIKSGNDSLAMRTDLFDFELPAGSIALRPASPRDSARMLIVQPDGGLVDRVVADLPLWLKPGDQLVVNDTKVIAAKLSGRRIGRDTEPKIEATLTERLDGSRWRAFDRGAELVGMNFKGEITPVEAQGGHAGVLHRGRGRVLDRVAVNAAIPRGGVDRFRKFVGHAQAL